MTRKPIKITPTSTPNMNEKLLCRAHISDYWLLRHALFMHGQPVSIYMSSPRTGNQLAFTCPAHAQATS